MKKVFISYRREDSQHVVDRIYDALLNSPQIGAVFRDVSSVAPGEDFYRKTRDAIRGADVTVVVIGKKWLHLTGENGNRRLDESEDYVRFEIEESIRQGNSIIPVLIDNASMPSGHALPNSIQKLSQHNAAPVRPDPDFHNDIKRLINAIEKNNSLLIEQQSSNKKMQQLLAFVFGVVFISALLGLSILFPNPSDFQYLTFRITLSLAAAGVAAMIPGFLQVTIPNWLRAGGALAVFSIVYFFNPANLVGETFIEPNPTDQFVIALTCETSGRVTVNTYTFPYSDIKANSTYLSFMELVLQLPNQECSQSRAIVFRVQDEKEVELGSKLTLTDNGNLGAIVFPDSVISKLGGTHLAFTQVHSYLIENGFF